MAKEAITEERLEDAKPDGGETSAGTTGFGPASEAAHGLRATLDRASHGVRALGRAGAERAKDAEERALEIGKDLRGQGERAVAGVARQVEQNPLASVAIAFALGVLCASVVRRG